MIKEPLHGVEQNDARVHGLTVSELDRFVVRGTQVVNGGGGDGGGVHAAHRRTAAAGIKPPAPARPNPDRAGDAA